MMEKIPKTITANPNPRIMPTITAHLFIFASLICDLVAGPSLG